MWHPEVWNITWTQAFGHCLFWPTTHAVSPEPSCLFVQGSVCHESVSVRVCTKPLWTQSLASRHSDPPVCQNFVPRRTSCRSPCRLRALYVQIVRKVQRQSHKSVVPDTSPLPSDCTITRVLWPGAQLTCPLGASVGHAKRDTVRSSPHLPSLQRTGNQL